MKNTPEDATLDRAKLNALLFNNPLAHETKLNLLKEALANNKYCINSEHIAASLIDYTKKTVPSKQAEQTELA